MSGGGGLIVPAFYGHCVSCGRYGVLDENDSTCLMACDLPGPTRRAAPAPAARRPTCDCGAAAADPVSTRRDGGGGHSEWCKVRGLP